MMNSETSQVVAEGGAATVAIAFLQKSVTHMIPYALPALVLIILDLIYGVKAATIRGERVRLSTAIKKTVTKTFSYICWIILASTMAVSFDHGWLEWAVLGLVFGNELASIIGNYLETKGIHVSFLAFYKWVFKKGAEKAGVEVTQEEADEILVKQPRDKKTGRFVKKCGIVLEQEGIIEKEED